MLTVFDDVEQGIVLAEDIWVSAVSLLLCEDALSGVSSETTGFVV